MVIDDIMKLSQNDFLSIIDSTPLVSVDLIIENAKGEILLGKRLNRPAQNFWFVPGGRIQKNELIEDAIKRVSKVELGFELSVSDATLLGAYNHIYTDNFAAAKGINTHYVALGHKFTLQNNPQLKLDNQHELMRWQPVDALIMDEQVHPNTKLYFQ